MRQFLALLTLLPLFLNAQVAVNDYCQDALEILIPSNGFALDTFKSPICDVSNSGREIGELCSKELEDAGNCDKTVWFKFYLPTTRNVGVKLSQHDSDIAQIFSGFNVYKVKDCNYFISDLSRQLQPIGNFGVSGNSCLSQGWYMIQVGCKKKAKGELWIELQVNDPLSDSYDHIGQYFDISSKSWSQNFYQYMNVMCASITEAEHKVIKDSAYSKSIWLSLNTFSNFNEQLFELYGSDIKCRIFMDDVNQDSILSKKPFISGKYMVSILKELCSTTSNRKIFVQAIVKTEVNYIYLNVVQTNVPKDNWSTTATNCQLQLDKNKVYEENRQFTCEGLLSLHDCKNIIPRHYIRSSKSFFYPYSSVVDTFDYAGYMVLEPSESGVLEVSVDQWLNSPIAYALYEGDISSSCNLVFKNDSVSWGWTKFRACVATGKYTLVVYGKSVVMGRMKFNINLNVVEEKSIYTHPLFPEVLPSFHPQNSPSIASELSSFGGADTSMDIAGVKFKGRLVFRELNVQTLSDIKLSAENNGYLYVFKGRISDGTISQISGVNYKKFLKIPEYEVQESNQFKRCFYLPAGDYTLISYLPKTDVQLKNALSCDKFQTKVVIVKNPVCPSSNTEPANAIKLNSNAGVFNHPAFAKDSLNSMFKLLSCNNCGSYTSDKPMLSSLNSIKVNDYTVYSFYTFKLEEDASFYSSSLQYELYVGDVTANSNVIKDTLNIVGIDRSGKYICNLKRGLYTLVLINQSNSYPYYVSFYKHRRSYNDYMVNACDLGYVSTAAESKGEYITCQTSGLVNDPRYLYGYWNDPKDLEMKYKDVAGYKRNYLGNKNIWYTFTVSGNSEVTIDLGNFIFSNSYQGVLYKYKGKYEQDFSAMVAKGFDSSLMNLEMVYYGSQFKSSGKFKFNNDGCQNNRYFFVLDRMPDYFSFEEFYSKYFKVKVSVNPLTSVSEGDMCSNPESVNVTAAGTYNLNSDNTCHTYGGSPFETDSATGVKSTWYKLKVSQMDRFDISIKNIGSKGLKNFTLYGGYCGALTKITRSNDKYGYFTLSCMEAGEYYIQAVSDKLVAENLVFEVSIAEGSNSVCKPYDFKYPLAQFTYTGGCQNQDSIQFTNKSTNGLDIAYKWYLNGVLFSNLQHPLLLRNSPVILNENEIMLVVENQALNYSDTFISKYKKDDQIYAFEIVGKAEVKCMDSFDLKVQTNYPYKINYTWLDRTSKVMTDKYYYKGFAYGKIRVKGISDNCVFYDEMTLKYKNSLNQFKDTVICLGQTYKIVNNKSTDWILNGDDGRFTIGKGDSYELDNSGRYTIGYTDSGCNYTDSFKVTYTNSPSNVSTFEDVYNCDNDSVWLSYTKYPITGQSWSNGSTEPKIKVHDNGSYVLNAKVGSCSVIKHVFNVIVEDLNKKQLRDTIVCTYSNYTLSNPYASAFSVTGRSPDLNEIKVMNSFERTLSLQRGSCVFSDTALVQAFDYEGKHKDTSFCSNNKVFEVALNAGKAKQYDWMGTGYNHQIYVVRQYGNYPVYRIDDHGCNDTIHFSVFSDCDFSVFIPDVFSPNRDRINDVFKPVVSGKYHHYELKVYNRWGELVYQNENSGEWDGSHMDRLVQQGVYSYFITVYDENMKQYVFNGTLSILR